MLTEIKPESQPKQLSTLRESLKQRLLMLFVVSPSMLLVVGTTVTLFKAPDSCKQSPACFASHTLSSMQRGLRPIVDPVGTLLYAPDVAVVPLIIGIGYLYYFVFTTLLQVLYALFEVVISLRTKGKQGDDHDSH